MRPRALIDERRRSILAGSLFCLLFGLIVAVNAGLVAREKSTEFNADFDVFRAAAQVTVDGGNPYVRAELMDELSRPDRSYNQNFRDDPASWQRAFFNPPLWFVELSLVGWRADVFVVGSAMLFAAALWVWRRSVAFSIWWIVPVFLAWDRSLLSGNGRIGQTGYLIAGLLGLSLYWSRRHPRWAGGAALLLAYKPHIWFAQWLIVLRRDRRAGLAQLVGSIGLGLVSIAVLGPGIWFRYVESLFTTHTELPTGMSIAYAASFEPLSTGIGFFAAAVVTAVAIAVLLGRDLLSKEAEFVVVVAAIMLASGHALWYDWAWLLLVPFVLGWSPARSAAFLLAYPLTYAIGLYAAPIVITLAMLWVVLYTELVTQNSLPVPGPSAGPVVAAGPADGVARRRRPSARRSALERST